MTYSIIASDDRLAAVDEHGIEICGAYWAHNCWNLYCTKLIEQETHLRTPPHHEHFWSDHGRVDSQHWVETIAALYVLATGGQPDAPSA